MPRVMISFRKANRKTILMKIRRVKSGMKMQAKNSVYLLKSGHKPIVVKTKMILRSYALPGTNFVFSKIIKSSESRKF